MSSPGTGVLEEALFDTLDNDTANPDDAFFSALAPLPTSGSKRPRSPVDRWVCLKPLPACKQYLMSREQAIQFAKILQSHPEGPTAVVGDKNGLRVLKNFLSAAFLATTFTPTFCQTAVDSSDKSDVCALFASLLNWPRRMQEIAKSPIGAKNTEGNPGILFKLTASELTVTYRWWKMDATRAFMVLQEDDCVFASLPAQCFVDGHDPLAVLTIAPMQNFIEQEMSAGARAVIRTMVGASQTTSSASNPKLVRFVVNQHPVEGEFEEQWRVSIMLNSYGAVTHQSQWGLPMDQICHTPARVNPNTKRKLIFGDRNTFSVEYDLRYLIPVTGVATDNVTWSLAVFVHDVQAAARDRMGDPVDASKLCLVQCFQILGDHDGVCAESWMAVSAQVPEEDVKE